MSLQSLARPEEALRCFMSLNETQGGAFVTDQLSCSMIYNPEQMGASLDHSLYKPRSDTRLRLWSTHRISPASIAYLAHPRRCGCLEVSDGTASKYDSDPFPGRSPPQSRSVAAVLVNEGCRPLLSALEACYCTCIPPLICHHLTGRSESSCQRVRGQALPRTDMGLHRSPDTLNKA